MVLESEPLRWKIRHGAVPQKGHVVFCFFGGEGYRTRGPTMTWKPRFFGKNVIIMKLPLGLYPAGRRVRDHQFILRESCRYDLSTSTNWFAKFPPTTWHFIDLQGVPWWKWRSIAKKINFHHVGSHVCKLIRVTPTMSTNFRMFQRCFTNDVTLRLGVFLPIRRCLWRRSRIIFDLDGETVIHGELSGLIKGCQWLCGVYPQKCMPKMAIFQKGATFSQGPSFSVSSR